MSCSVKDCLGTIFNKSKQLCGSCYKRQYRLNNIDRVRTQERAQSLKHKAKTIVTSKRWKTSDMGRYKALLSEAKRRGHAVDLLFSDFTKLLKLPCEYCQELEITPNFGYRLDRIENSMGYNLNNVIPCCASCNRIRSDKLTYIEMIVAMRAVSEFRAGIKLTVTL